MQDSLFPGQEFRGEPRSGEVARRQAKTPNQPRVVDDGLTLFEGETFEAPLLPGQEARRDYRRLAWRRRQKRCRALRKWRAQTAAAPQIPPRPPVDETRWMVEAGLVANVLRSRQWAEAAARLIAPADLHHELFRLIYSVAVDLVRQGIQPTRATVVGRLRREGVTLAFGDRILDLLPAYADRDFDETTRLLKQA